ncbi:MAG: helix-turn-helix domain-containing protein [Candidatus Cybelea sp.]
MQGQDTTGDGFEQEPTVETYNVSRKTGLVWKARHKVRGSKAAPKHYVSVYQKALRAIVDEQAQRRADRLRPREIVLFLHLLGWMTYGQTWHFTNLRDVSAATGLTRSNVSAALARLCDRGLIARAGEDYLLNPEFAYMGAFGDYDAAKERWHRANGKTP